MCLGLTRRANMEKLTNQPCRVCVPRGLLGDDGSGVSNTGRQSADRRGSLAGQVIMWTGPLVVVGYRVRGSNHPWRRQRRNVETDVWALGREHQLSVLGCVFEARPLAPCTTCTVKFWRLAPTSFTDTDESGLINSAVELTSCNISPGKRKQIELLLA